MTFRKRILICDDNKKQREQLSLILKPDYEIFEVDSANLLIDKVGEKSPIHLIILDLMYSDQMVDPKVLADLYNKNPNLKVVIYSTLLSRSNTEDLGNFLKSVERPSQIAGFIGTNESSEVQKFKIDNILGLPSVIKNKQIWILHVSDPQFGGKGLTADFIHKKLWNCLSTFISNEETMNSELDTFCDYPDFMIMSGDITEHARPQEFKSAQSFVDGLTTLMNNKKYDMVGILRNSNHLSVPGNHDINWDISRSRSIFNGKDYKPDSLNGPDLDYLADYSWLPYASFDCPENGKDWHIDPGFRIVDLKNEARLIIVCLNSSKWGINHVTNTPYIPESALESIGENLEKIDPSHSATRILVVHHTLYPYAADQDRLVIEGSKDPSSIVKFFSKNCKFSIVLTGHVHDEVAFDPDTGHDKRSLLNIGAGTLMSADSEQAPQFNLIRLHSLSPDHNRYEKCQIYTFSWYKDHYKINLIGQDGTSKFREFVIKYER